MMRSKSHHTLSLSLLAMGLCLLIVSCSCNNYSKNGSRQGEQVLKSTAAHLLLTSNTNVLEGKQTSFEISIENEQEAVANLHAYSLKLRLQEEGGTGSKLEYQDALQQKHVESSIIEKPLSHFFQQPTLKKEDIPLRILFKLYPLGSNVTKILVSITLEHQEQKDKVIPLAITWNKLPPITDQLIQFAKDKKCPYLADMLTKLQQGQAIDVNQRGNNGYAALHQAAYIKDMDSLHVLLSRGANPDIQDANNGYTPLHYAVLDGNLPMVQQLIEAGANLNLEDNIGMTPLMYVVQKKISQAPEVAKLLIKNLTPAQLNQKNEDGKTALSWATWCENDQIASDLLQKLVISQIRETSGSRNDILYWAIKNGRTDLALVLIEHGNLSQLNNVQPANIFVPLNPHDINFRPLEYAIRKKNDTIALRLIEKLTIEQLNQKNQNKGYTPLQEAVMQDNIKIAEALIKKGVAREVPINLVKSPAMRELLAKP